MSEERDQEVVLNHLAWRHGRNLWDSVGQGYADYAYDLHSSLHRERDYGGLRPHIKKQLLGEPDIEPTA